MVGDPMQFPVTLDGGCHCGAVRYRVILRKRQVVECNCSICVKKGYLHMIVPREDFRLECGEDSLTTYTFGTHTAQHHFCRMCGVHSFYIPRSHPDAIDINVRCLQQDILSQLEIKAFNGREWEEHIGELIMR